VANSQLPSFQSWPASFAPLFVPVQAQQGNQLGR